MSPESEQLKAARASGSLTNVVGVLREEARTELANAGTPAREQVGLEDSAIRVAAGMTGKSDVERRAALREVRPGSTVTSKGIAKTLLSRAEKLNRVKAWGAAMSEEARTEYMIGQQYAGLSEKAQDVIAEAFAQLDELAYENSIGIENIDLDAPTPDVDSIIGGDEEDGEADDPGTADWEAMFEPDHWEGESS
jgi:hypothetical protein